MRREIAHPLVIYNFFFLFYSISFPVLALSSLKMVDQEILQKAVFCNSLGFTAFALGVVLCTSKIPPRVLINYKKYFSRYKLKPYHIPYLLLILFLLISILPLFKITSLGFINKQEIKRSGETFLRIYSIFYPLIIFTVAYIIDRFERGQEKISYIVIAVGIFYSTIVLGITGERDILFYFTLMILLYLCDVRKKFTGFILITILFVCVFLLPVSNMLKNYIISGEEANVIEVLNNGFIGLLQSDFTSATSNLYNIIYYTYEFHNGERLINDILRVFSSNFLGINFNAMSSTEWYKVYFINNNGAGRGFSIVAEGYLDFGYMGILFLMFIIGFFLQTLYRYRYLNSLAYVYYIFTLLVSCYCIRADMANLINNSLKSGLLPLLFIFSYQQLFFNRKHKNEALD